MSYEEIEYIYKNTWVMGIDDHPRSEVLKHLPETHELVSTITFVQDGEPHLLDTFKVVPLSERV
ncbi:hypothetical protein GCM10027030_07980 [Luteococcus sediminum]